MRASLNAGGVLLEGRLEWDDASGGWSIVDPLNGERHPLIPELLNLAGHEVRISLFRTDALEALLRAVDPSAHPAPDSPPGEPHE